MREICPLRSFAASRPQQEKTLKLLKVLTDKIGVEKKYNELFEEWDLLIKSGKSHRVKNELFSIRLKMVPPSHIGTVARFCNRVGAYSHTLKFLFPLIREKGKFLEESLLFEIKAEYGLALAQIGLNKEAEDILSFLPIEQFPKAGVYLIFSLFSKWDYKGSIPILEKVLRHEKDPYQLAIAQLNLLAAYIQVKDFHKAELNMKDLYRQCNESGYDLLKGYIAELKTQMLVESGDFKTASIHIADSLEKLKGTETRQMLYARKWQIIVSMKQGATYTQVSDAISDLRQSAKNLSDWETLRDIDRRLAVAYGDQKLFSHVYFGTPWANFKKQLADQAKEGHVGVQDQWLINDRIEGGQRVFDLKEGHSDDQKVTLKPGQLLHRMTSALCEDFYRPATVGVLFSRVFPDEYYDPGTSNERIYKGIRRLKDWGKESGLGVVIECEQGNYQIKIPENWAIRVHREKGVSSHSEHQVSMLSSHLTTRKPKSSSQLSRELGVSKRTINRMITEGIEAGEIVQIGRGRATKYVKAS